MNVCIIVEKNMVTKYCLDKYLNKNVRLFSMVVMSIILAGCVSLSSPSDGVYVTIDLQVDPEKTEEFLAIMADAAPDTRSFDGCRKFDIYVDQDKPGHILFYEIWDSKEQQQTYLKWRQETGFLDKIGPYFIAELNLSFYSRQVE